jgi:hypothetical protein
MDGQTMQPQAPAVPPEIQAGRQVLGNYGLDDDAITALQQMTKAEAANLLAAYHNQVQQSQSIDMTNEALLDQMLAQDEWKDVSSYRNEAAAMLRASMPQYKAQGATAVQGVLTHVWGAHRKEIMDKLRSEARQQAGRDQQILSESVSGTTVTVEGKEINLDPAQRAQFQYVVDTYNEQLSEADKADPDKLMTLEKYVARRAKSESGVGVE